MTKTPDQLAAEKHNRELNEKWAAAIAAAGAATEVQMRDMEAAHPKSLEELTEAVRALVERPHDYGTCVYAMSLAATAAFNFVASKLGVTGFQASCADLDVLRRTRGYKHGFMILDGWNVLYPQYDLVAEAHKFVLEKRAELKDEARKLLEENKTSAVPEVREHWRKIARGVS